MQIAGNDYFGIKRRVPVKFCFKCYITDRVEIPSIIFPYAFHTV